MGKTEQRIAEFIVETSGADIPERSYEAVRKAVYDCVGVTLAGSVQPHGEMIVNFAKREGGSGESTIIGSGHKTSASMAALANGTLGHALDYDDMGGFGHPSVALLPAALAIGEQKGISGRDLLAAYIVGFEVGNRLSKGSHYVQGERGFHSTSLFGTMAATAVSARLLGLDVHQTLMALGAAGSMSSGVLQNFGTYTKPLHAGLAGRNGVMAAQLANDGWLASEDIIESKVGWAAAFIGQGNYDTEKMTEGLGTKWASADSIVIKKYPCCGSNHSTLDSLIGLISENGITLDDVDEVEVTGFPAISHVLLYPEPSYAYQGKFSVNYSAATALVDGRVNMDSYSNDKLNRSEYQEAARKIEIKTLSNWDPAYSAHPIENPVTVRLKDGRTLTRSTDRHSMHGTPADPLSDDEYQAKFRANAGLVLTGQEVNEATEKWWDIGAVQDVRTGMAVLSRSMVSR